MILGARLRRTRAILAVAGILLAVVGIFGLDASPAFAGGATITGGGSSFGALEMQQWTASVASNPYNLTVNFVTNSSGQGRSSFANGTFDYGMSDIPYPPTEADLATLQGGRCHGASGTGCFVYVPVTAGALAFPFSVSNNSGQAITKLNLTPDDVCKIFTGGITNWGDTQLVSTNPALSGVDKQIGVVVRSDPAGESYVLSQYCIAKDPTVWANFMNGCNQIRANSPDETCSSPTDPTSYWPSVLPANGSTGSVVQTTSLAGADQTANAVSQSAAQNNSDITYVAAGYAVQRGLPMANVENASGQFVPPSSEGVSVALGYATPRGDGTFNLNFNGPDTRAYFPSTYSYILAQTGGGDASKGATLGKFICYDLGFGQVGVQVLKYAPLNSAVVAISEAAEAQIPGGIPAASCTAGAPGAPPPPTVAPLGSATNATASGTGAATGSAASGAAANGGSAASGSAAGTAGSGHAGTGAGTSGTGGQSQQSAAALQTEARDAAAKSGKGPSLLAPIAEGAAVCALGLGAAGMRKKATP